MKAAVVRAFEEPLRIEDRPVPTPSHGQVQVKMETCGLCHTDIHAAHGDWPVKPTPPFVPGHEGVGIVTGLGEGVSGLAEGDRVAVPWLGYASGACEYCASGRETLCPNQSNSGYSVDGAYAEFAVADAAFVGKVPVGLDPLDAAPSRPSGVSSAAEPWSSSPYPPTTSCTSPSSRRCSRASRSPARSWVPGWISPRPFNSTPRGARVSHASPGSSKKSTSPSSRSRKVRLMPVLYLTSVARQSRYARDQATSATTPRSEA